MVVAMFMLPGIVMEWRPQGVLLLALIRAHLTFSSPPIILVMGPQSKRTCAQAGGVGQGVQTEQLSLTYRPSDVSPSPRKPPFHRYRYIKLFGTAYSDGAFGIAADSSQNAYVVGYTGGSLSVGGYSFTAKGSGDACKYYYF